MLKRVALVLIAGVCVLGAMSGCAEKKTGLEGAIDKAADKAKEGAKEAEKKVNEELNK